MKIGAVFDDREMMKSLPAPLSASLRQFGGVKRLCHRKAARFCLASDEISSSSARLVA
jgi:hypothetical protein